MALASADLAPVAGVDTSRWGNRWKGREKPATGRIQEYRPGPRGGFKRVRVARGTYLQAVKGREAGLVCAWQSDAGGHEVLLADSGADIDLFKRWRAAVRWGGRKSKAWDSGAGAAPRSAGEPAYPM